MLKLRVENFRLSRRRKLQFTMVYSYGESKDMRIVFNQERFQAQTVLAHQMKILAHTLHPSTLQQFRSTLETVFRHENYFPTWELPSVTEIIFQYENYFLTLEISPTNEIMRHVDYNLYPRDFTFFVHGCIVRTTAARQFCTE